MPKTQWVIEIDFVELIQNCLAVAGSHRDRLFRLRLSIITPLSNTLVRKTKTPIWGPRRPITPWSGYVVPTALAKSGAKFLKTELALLQEFQNLHHLLLVTKGIPSTQIPKLMKTLSRLPVLSITSLAVDANVSRDTAKRWLVGLQQSGKLQSRDLNGMKQFSYSAVIEILDLHVRFYGAP